MNTYFMQKPRLFAASLGVVALTLLPSCQDEDFGYSAEQIRYAKSFTEVYGEIPTDKNWDLSSFASWTDVVNNGGTRAGGYSNAAPTKGQLTASQFSTSNSWYEVDKNLLDWCTNQLEEGADNRYLGSSFFLQLPANDFAIIPIFQGGSSIMSELEVKINDYQITKIWTKSDGIEAKRTSSSSWEPVRYWEGYDNVIDGVFQNDYTIINQKTIQTSSDIYWWWNEYPNAVECQGGDDHGNRMLAAGSSIKWPDAKYHSASTIGDFAVRSHPIIFNRNNISAPESAPYMYLSLRNIYKNPVPQGFTGHFDGNGSWVTDLWSLDSKGNIITKLWDANNEWTTIGDRLTSINSDGLMLALHVPDEFKPSAEKMRAILGITDSNAVPECIIVGCEDANGAGSDHDNNDVVFMIVGYPNVPQIVPTTEIISKRYMCEDLGATDDFDFNDVVIDVKQTRQLSISMLPEGTASNSVFNTGMGNSQYGSGSSVEIVGVDEISKVQTAKIAHVCGTLPIQVRVGNYFYPVFEDPTVEYDTRSRLMQPGYYYGQDKDHFTRAQNEVREEGWNPNEEKVIEDNSWNPATNNIVIYVDWTPVSNNIHISQEFNLPEDGDERSFVDFSKDSNVKHVMFSKPGTVPYIIATDITTPWMKERMDIPKSWVTGDMRVPTEGEEATHIASPGSAVYYENYGSDKSDAILWKGSIKGSAKITKVDLSGDTYKAGIQEAKDKHFNIINVYTKPVSAKISANEHVYTAGIFKLCYKNGGEWTTLFEGQVPEASRQVVVNDVTGATEYKNSIMLTGTQLSTLASNGLAVFSLSNGLEITQISMSRIYDNEGHTDQNTSFGSYQKGATLTIKKSANGHIEIEDRVSTAKDFYNSDYSVLYPYAVPAYSEFTGGFNSSRHDQGGYVSSVTLNAIADAGHAFSHWKDNENNKSKTRTISIINGENQYEAVFLTADVPDLKLSESSDAKLTLLAGTTYDVYVTSKNQSTPLTIGDYDSRYIVVDYNNSNKLTIHANAAGTVKFKIKQPDGEHNNTLYAASSEIEIEVVVRELPKAEIPLTAAMFYEWNTVAWNAHVIGNGDIVSSLNQTVSNSGEYATTILGSRYNSYQKEEYADLNQTNLIIINTKKDTDAPLLWFTKGVQSKEEVNAGNSTYCYSLTHDDITTYVVDVAAIRASIGFSILSAITTQGGQGRSSKVLSVYVDSYSSEAAEAWAANRVVTVTTNLAGASASVNGKSSDTVAPGTSVTLNASAPNIPSDETDFHRYTFEGWYIGSTQVSSDETCSYTPASNVELEARYVSEWRVVSTIKFNGRTDVDCGYVNVTYNGTISGGNDIWAPVGAIVNLKAVAKTGYVFSTWGWTNKNPRDHEVVDRKPNEGMPNSPTATFAKLVADGIELSYWTNNTDNSNHTYKLQSIKNDLFTDGNDALLFYMDKRIKKISLNDGWTSIANVSVDAENGRCVFDNLTAEQIQKIKDATDLQLHVWDPTSSATSNNLPDATKLTVGQYKK